MKDLLTSTETANLIGVTSSTIKRWVDEGRMNCIVTPGGHRRISRSEIDRFLRTSGARSESDHAHLLKMILDDEGAYSLQALLMSLRGQHGTWAAVADIAGQSLRELGRRWQNGVCSIAQEHAASHRLQQAMFACMSALPSPPLNPVCLLSAVEGDQHTLGLSLADICLREAGWSGHWLGSPTPTSAVLEVIDSTRPDMVAISASEASSDIECLSGHLRVIEKACQKHGTNLVLAGGGAWPDRPVRSYRIRSFSEFASLLADLSVQSKRG